MKRVFISNLVFTVLVVSAALLSCKNDNDDDDEIKKIYGQNRAGQILYKHISGYTYEFTLTTFTYCLSLADRPELEISWGDNTSSIISRIPRDRKNVEILPDNYQRNIYIGQHTFPAPGVYTVIVSDSTRNLGIENIPNSIDIQFGLKTILIIDTNIGHNSTPEFLNYPIGKAAVGRKFVHNPAAYDTDGDSLSYELAICLREDGIEIETYTFPEASNELYVDPVYGDFVWDTPIKAGIYNFAMRINKWRYGIKIGSVIRDMQIEVIETDNRPPELPNFKDTCVIAGEKISITFDITDPDNDFINLTAVGTPFQLTESPATLTINSSEPGKTTATFTWQTNSSHVRDQPYTVVFKAEDQNSDIKFVTLTNFNITVIEIN